MNTCSCQNKPGKMVHVGIMHEKEIEMVLNGDYEMLTAGDPEPAVVTGKVSLSAHNCTRRVDFKPLSADCSAEVMNVTIGVNFHWERRETQRFKGSISIVPDNGELVVINILSVEDYLESVISSEMSATSSLELLKAHAVISRSWVLAQIQNKSCGRSNHSSEMVDNEHERVIWYDHDTHSLFDVCADDHCQRYQGITRQTSPTVAEAVNATRGEIIYGDGELCDARFSKCCGGVFEVFETCWENVPKSYLQPLRDLPEEHDFPDLTKEENAREWILGNPEAFCNTNDARVLSEVLNNYDQETAHFYRWTVEYDTDTLSELVKRRSGIDFGRIIDMVPMERGTSGRLKLLKIVGEKRTMNIGKELEIRRILSESHLYSSAFVVEKTADGFRLHGAGWGHGVGLCQIGAAVMADRGYDYRQILAHYYPGSEIRQFDSL